MERAEKLKTFLNENDPSNKRKPSAMGANGKSAGGSGKGGYAVPRKQSPHETC
jgi:vacuolar protein-sorting-associated protein 4